MLTKKDDDWEIPIPIKMMFYLIGFLCCLSVSILIVLFIIIMIKTAGLLITN